MPRKSTAGMGSAAGSVCLLGLTLAAASAHATPTEPGTLTHPLDAAVGCQGCHAFGNAPAQAADPPYAPFHWQGTLMANAARDPVFWAGVALAAQDAPGETETCIRCHSPRAFLEGRGAAVTPDELTPDDFDGVTCDICHRQIDDGQTPPGNAAYVIDDTDVDGQAPKRGPWSYGGPPMPPHPVQQDGFTGSSRMCGTCHDVTTFRERVDDDGNGLGVGFNEQRTYSEWANSAYGRAGPEFRSCQDCHMPAVADVSGCANFVNLQLHPTGGRRHDLVGANRFVLEILRDLHGDTGDGAVPSVWFDRTLERMDAFLPQSAAVEVDLPEAADAGAGFEIGVTVTNRTGHKLPTGYSEGRIAWLEVTTRYAGQVLWSSGAWEPGEGPTGDPLLRTYQAVAENRATGQTFHLLTNDHWVEDTRIPPKGLVPDPETDPVTDRYPLLDDGTWAHYDTVTYAFEPRDVWDLTPDVPDDDVLEVEVRLLYLINTNDYVDLLAADNVTNGAGETVKMLFDDRGGAVPVVLGSWQGTLPLRGLRRTDVATGGSTEGGAQTGPGTSSGPPPGDTVATTGAAEDGTARGGGCGCRADAADPHGRWGASGAVAILLGGRSRRRRKRRFRGGPADPGLDRPLPMGSDPNRPRR